MVTMTVAEHNTDVSFYEAGYKRQICTVLATASALTCSPEGLSAGTRFRVFAMACMAGFECSHRKFADGYTFPDGKEDTWQCFLIVFLFINDISSTI